MTISMNGHGPAVLRVTPGPSPVGVSLRLTGEMDVATGGHLTEIIRALPVNLLRHVRLDLTDLAFIDASGLTELVDARTAVRSPGGQLTLHGPRPLLVRLLDMTDLTAMFDEGTVSALPNDR